MNLPFSSAVANTHAHATENEQRVLEALRTLLPEAVEVRRSNLKGHHGNTITGFNAKVDRKALLRELLDLMLTKLRAGELDKLRNIALARVDDSCRLYLRFDKQLAYHGELVLTDRGDAIHLKLKTASFPAKREVAIELVKKFIEMGRENEEET